MSIVSGAAPTGSSYLPLNLIGLACSNISLSQALLAANGFNVWGSVGHSTGGNPNDIPLGQVFGSSGASSGIPTSVPLTPALARNWTTLIFQQIGGGVATGTIEVEGATWTRAAILSPAIPTSPGTFSAAIDCHTVGPCFLFALDELAQAGDSYNVWGNCESDSGRQRT